MCGVKLKLKKYYLHDKLPNESMIMALGIISVYHEGKELFELVKTQVMLINSQFHSAPCDIAWIPIKV